MTSSALGAVAAVTASALFSAGLLLQSLEARTVPAERSFRLSLIAGLLGRRRWVLGGLLMALGFGVHVCALLLAPLTVVQPSLAAGLVVLLVVGARSDGEQIRAREVLAVGAISLGVLGLTLTAPERTTISAGALALAGRLAPPPPTAPRSRRAPPRSPSASPPWRRSRSRPPPSPRSPAGIHRPAVWRPP